MLEKYRLRTVYDPIIMFIMIHFRGFNMGVWSLSWHSLDNVHGF